MIGASAGGVEALRTVARCLPADLPAAVFVVLHLAPFGVNALAGILAYAGPLPAEQARSGVAVRAGRIVVAGPDRHLMLADRHVHLSGRPAMNGHRPSLDVLFRSAAREYGPGVVGIVLSGDGDDGAGGLATVVRLGGVAVVQDPASAEHPSMPRRALRAVPGAEVRPADEIGAYVADLVRGSADRRARSVAVPAARGTAGPVGVDLEAALSAAVRALDDRSRLSEKMARGRRAVGNTAVAGRYEDMAAESAQASAVIRQWMGSHSTVAEATDRT